MLREYDMKRDSVEIIYNYMDINLTFETSTTSVGLVSIDPGFVEK